MSEHNLPFGLDTWIEAHIDDFAPPVSNKVVWTDSDFIFMIVHGPNARSDFHIDPGDEIFYQLHGAIRVDILDDDGTRHRRIVHEGDIMLVPAGTPHAPMRPAGSWGLVIERPRRHDEYDELLWICEVCGTELHRHRFLLNDIETELKAAIETFNSSADLRTCVNGHLNPVPEAFSLDSDTD